MDTKKHYEALRKEREKKLEERYGKRVRFSCVHTLTGQKCPNFSKDGDCHTIYMDHMYSREYAVIGEEYYLTRDDIMRIFKVCDEYHLSVDITAELSTHNIGCTTLVAIYYRNAPKQEGTT